MWISWELFRIVLILSFISFRAILSRKIANFTLWKAFIFLIHLANFVQMHSFLHLERVIGCKSFFLNFCRWFRKLAQLLAVRRWIIWRALKGGWWRFFRLISFIVTHSFKHFSFSFHVRFVAMHSQKLPLNLLELIRVFLKLSAELFGGRFLLNQFSLIAFFHRFCLFIHELINEWLDFLRFLHRLFWTTFLILVFIGCFSAWPKRNLFVNVKRNAFLNLYIDLIRG